MYFSTFRRNCRGTRGKQPCKRAAFVLAAIALGSLVVSARTGLAADDRQKPNILIVLADDMGFSDLGCYGGEIETPHLDRLANDGLRFTQFYNTARCWPTRTALLTGYYPQQVRADPPKGRLPLWARTAPQYLKPLGYRCYHSGKWHVPGAPRVLADGGFDRSYKLDDHDRNFNPRRHTADDQPLPPVEPGSGYYTTTAMADYTIRQLKEHAADHAGKPFFAYLAFTVPHFPLQAPAADIARYRELYRQGWDKLRAERYRRQKEMGLVNGPLSQPEPQVAAPGGGKKALEQLGEGEILNARPWSDLDEAQKEFQAAKMAVHAAMVHRMDADIGRVFDQVRAMGAWENTVIFFFSDNGASAEILVRGDGHDPKADPGSAGSFLCLGPGGSTLANTPFRRHKIWVHEGGVATPLIVHWPQGIKARGELRHDVGHVVDFMPTLLELAGGMPGDKWNGFDVPPLPGKSLVPAFARDRAVERNYVFFHHSGNRALRMGDWKIVSAADNENSWELYDLAADRCETTNLAAQQPDRLREMSTRWQALEDEFRRQSQVGVPNEELTPKAKRE